MADQEKPIGALWAKESERGAYFTGEIEIDGVKTKIVAFQNSFKTEDKHPDWRILRSKPKA